MKSGDPNLKSQKDSFGPCSKWPQEKGETIRQILQRVGDKWAMLIIGSLTQKKMRYSDILLCVPGISQRMLTRTLQTLTQDGVISRTAYGEVPPRVEYELTPLGESMVDSVTALIDWAGTHHDEIIANRLEYQKLTKEKLAKPENV